MKEHLVVTLGCEYGSGGPEIGKIIAGDLGLEYYDRELIDAIIAETGLSEDVLRKLEAGAEIRGRNPELAGRKSPTKYSVLTGRIVYLQTQVVRKLAERASCVIIGRCSDYVLRDRTDTLNAFIYAPEDVRIAHVMEREGLSGEEAARRITEQDRMLHARYMQMTGTYRGDRHNRHILIDSSVLGFEGTAKLIEDFARQKLGGEEAS